LLLNFQGNFVRTSYDDFLSHPKCVSTLLENYIVADFSSIFAYETSEFIWEICGRLIA